MTYKPTTWPYVQATNSVLSVVYSVWVGSNVEVAFTLAHPKFHKVLSTVDYSLHCTRTSERL